ncbi:MAG: malonate decarboxylase subunit delta [Candidatus Eremiobacteraeota bacterium]|nr:malonate decarboxylase subunit delta [Candidatus Eremiobacteraeota bacterium]
MEHIELEYPASRAIAKRAHVGVVGSGDLEVLLEPAAGYTSAQVRIRTSVDGFEDTWKVVLGRFFARHPVAARVDINDFGATPGLVALRLEQALELSTT